MGNSLSFREWEDREGPQGVDFFKSLKLRWVLRFFHKVKESGQHECFDLERSELQRLSWRRYFHIFSEIKEEVKHHEVEQTRATWHPASIGYVMRPGALPDFVAEFKKSRKKGIPTDFTDDEETSEEEEEEEDLEEEEEDLEEDGEEEGAGFVDGDGDGEDEDEDEREGGDGPETTSKPEDGPPNDAGGASSSSTRASVKVRRQQRRASWAKVAADEEAEIAASSSTSIGGPRKKAFDGGSDPAAISSSSILTKQKGSITTDTRKIKPWDPSTRSPVYFGYHDTTVKMVADEREAERNKNISAENRALGRAREARSSILNSVERVCAAASDERLVKIEEIDRKYEAASARREKELLDKQKELPESGFRVYKRQWDSEFDAATAAYEAEVGQLRFVHHVKSATDATNMAKRREELEAFKDAEAQEVPAAERLEEISKVEIGRWVDECGERGEALDKARSEYAEMREELEYLLSKGINKKNEKQLRELRSVVNHAESLVRERQRAVEEAIGCLADAEALLDRAIRTKKQQDQLLPLFALIALEPSPSSVRVDFMAVAFAILMIGSFEQKLNFVFYLYDVAGDGFFSSYQLQTLIALFQETLHRLHYIPYSPNTTEINNVVWRSFLDLGLRPGLSPESDYLTHYEVRDFVSALCGKSAVLWRLLGLGPSTQDVSLEPCVGSTTNGMAPLAVGGSWMCTYQRNKMSPLGLLVRGMVTPTVARYRIHHDTTRYWPHLNPRAKASTHERSLSMGEGDPLRPDYTKFMAQQTKKRSPTIPPLEHGHLSYLSFVEKRQRDSAATKIQSLLRAHADRKIADLRAKRAAFLDAKEMAMREMKAKVVKEFKKREALTGAAKMKWDAQVRMKQAKIKSDGQNLQRAETVMLMMEEAISKAKLDIEAKFKKLEEKEDFMQVSSLQPRLNKYHTDLSKDQNVKDMFGIDPKVSVAMNSLVGIVEGRDRGDGPSAFGMAKAYGDPGDGQVGGTGPGASGGGGVGDNEAQGQSEAEANADAVALAASMGTFNRQRAQATIEGAYRWVFEPSHLSRERGESLMEQGLRELMQYSAPSADHYFLRLRAVHNAMSHFKVSGIVAELPSKRLLLKFVEAKGGYSLGGLPTVGGKGVGDSSNSELVKELRVHFRFTRNFQEVAAVLMQLVNSDFEWGIILEAVARRQSILEPGLRLSTSRQLSAAIDVLEVFLERKLATNETVTEESLLALDIERAVKYVNKYTTEILAIVQEIERQKTQFNRLLLSVTESEKKLRIANLLRSRRTGCRQGEVDPVVAIGDRQNWVVRLKSADRMPEETSAQREAKYAEIRAVAKEFIDTAQTDALLILSEHYQPIHRKTGYNVSCDTPVNGRSMECGRGCLGASNQPGRRLMYELHNIVYTVVEDYDGVFEGSDEWAAKAAGHDRRGASEYFKTHTPKLNVPPVATIDYAGFRVHAVAKLPTQNVIFNEEGEVRKITEDQVHGTIRNGDMFLNKHKTAHNALKSASLRLNLDEHCCRGLKDILAQSTCASADIKVFHSKIDDEFYCRQFSRAFPPEHPELTPHLDRSPRDQSIFWRQLRPELCRKYEGGKLSPDALCLIIQRSPDRDKQNAGVSEATNHLITTVIPALLADLAWRDFTSFPLSEGLGLDLTTELHSRGINIRHLGLLRSLLWRQLPGTVSLYFGEKMARTSVDLRCEIESGECLIVKGLGAASALTLADATFTISVDPMAKPDPTTHIKGEVVTSTTLPLDRMFMARSSKVHIACAGAAFLCMGHVKGQNHSYGQNSAPNAISSHPSTSSASQGHTTNTPYHHQNNIDLRTVLLAEMIARAVKGLVRCELRQYARKTGTISTQFATGTVLEYLNVITGAHQRANLILQNLVYPAVRERFGPRALRPSERSNIQELLTPTIIFTIKRITHMLGVQLHPYCLADLFTRPSLFLFCEIDLLDCVPRVRHSVPVLAYSDAMLIALKAQEAARLVYTNEVLEDHPVLFYRLYERKGARSAENKGSLGADFDGLYSRGVSLWQQGPISSDPHSRACGFLQGEHGYLDCKFHPKIVPQSFTDHFSIELFIRCTGGADTTRYIVMSGRYGLVLSKEGQYTFVFADGLSEVNVRFAPVVMDEWMHIVSTFDGTWLRCYVNGLEMIMTEIEPPLRQKSAVFESEMKEQFDEINIDETREADVVQYNTEKQAEAYFSSKSGIGYLKNESQNIMESDEFQALNIGTNERNEQKQIQLKRGAALEQAKSRYIKDLCFKNLSEIATRYKLKRDELADKVKKKRDEGNLRIRTTLRLGAAPPSAGSRVPEHCFVGDLSCFAVFDTCLSTDRVRTHYATALQDRSFDAQRLFAVAAVRYEEALLLAPDDMSVLQGFASTLCEYLKIEQSAGGTGASTTAGISRGKLKVLQAIDRFRAIGVPEGAAAILKAIPHDSEYALLVCRAFQTVKTLDRYFFSRGLNVTRQDLAQLPQIFGLDYPGNPQEYLDTAAAIYSEVCRDHTLAFSYGETDVSWVGELTSSELVVALLRHARDDKSLKLVQVGEMFKTAGRTKISITDEDVAVLTGNSVLTVGFDFTGCSLLTNQSLVSLGRTTSLRILSLENCTQVDDRGLTYLLDISERLEVINFSGLPLISDKGLAMVFKACQRLQGVSLNGCSQLSFEVLHVAAVHNKRIATLHASGLQISDGGMSLICSALSANHMKSLDISMCREISDFGAMAVADACPNLKYLNIAGLSRISDVGARALCAKCWYLETLNVEDVFLLGDESFRYSFAYDGRVAADEHMLRHLVILNLRDCVNLTDKGVQGLAERSRKIQTLILRGCDKITDKALVHLSTAHEFTYPLCDALRILDVSYCSGITSSGILDLLPLCGVLEELRVSGLVSVNDAFALSLCRVCKTVQRLIAQKCVFLTDAALCCLAEYMWVEELDVSGCHRLTDDGIEVLTSACTGLTKLLVAKCSKLTTRAINSVARNIRGLQLLDVQSCPLVTEKCLNDLLNRWPYLNLTK